MALNERLHKFIDYLLISRSGIARKVSRAEYALASAGAKLSAIIESIRDLDEEHESTQKA